jgi:hypothetical protein
MPWLMGPVTSKTNIELPVARADRPAQGEAAMRGEQDERRKRGQRRRRESEPQPDADSFTHQESSES